MRVVLVHGFLNRGSIFVSLARALRVAGHECLVPSLKPCDGREGIDALARQLKTEVDVAWGDSDPIVLVGFSMGAIVARSYLVHLGGFDRTRFFASIAGPHQGTWTAGIYPSRGAREMQRGSPYLKDLNEGPSVPQRIPTVCYWSRFDLMIRPHASTLLTGAAVVEVPALVHSLLLFDRRLASDLCQRLACIQV